MEKYCLDTSFLINGWNKDYPPSAPYFLKIWERVHELIESGQVLICHEVCEEVSRKDDGLLKWLMKSKKHVFHPTTSQTAAMRTLMERLPNIAAQPGRNVADPWVITCAQVTCSVVVTGETWEITKPTKPPKIPNVCEELGIAWLKPAEFIGKIQP